MPRAYIAPPPAAPELLLIIVRYLRHNESAVLAVHWFSACRYPFVRNTTRATVRVSWFDRSRTIAFAIAAPAAVLLGTYLLASAVTGSNGH
ncbi:hypothetical protein ACH47B_31260 [Rhodococcus sp. NPDC019627]|uniref:hypothetical protein n=1 Tax=unclassified Rhodococcus (in: high G+C Gram-positive bacteria) TaxID=192944 RepID=UPI0037B20F33